MLPTKSSKAEINGQTYNARRAYCPMSDAVKTKTSPLSFVASPSAPVSVIRYTASNLVRFRTGLVRLLATMQIYKYRTEIQIFYKKSRKSLQLLKLFLPLQSQVNREHSSVGLEHLPYKQRVGGSTPSAPTNSLLTDKSGA